MNSFLVLLIVVGVSAVKGEVDCTLKPETGLCLAYFPSFYYNGETGECESFVYGGCGGNSNRFHSKAECEITCQRSEEVDCVAAPEVGLCKGSFPRFFYDPDSRECKQFIYGGCGGNTNNFHTKESCLSRCSVEQPEVHLHDCESKADVGLCDAIIQRFFFNKETGHCERFVYGGCGGNGNNYKTADECKSTCGEAEEEPEVPVHVEAKLGKDCSSPAETGMCRAYFPSFFYNAETGQCEDFVYGGCGGNGNNYQSREECEEACGPRKEPVDCHSDPEVGLCQALFHMYYFDRHTGSCKEFIYGGCGGNNNRFESEKECEDTCLL